MTYPKFDTQEAVNTYLMEHAQKMKRYAGHTMNELADTFQPDEGPESKLQSKIESWAKEWGHPILSLRQSVKAKGFLTPGWPDIVLVLHKRTVFIELKSKRGRLSDHQKLMRIQFMSHGHDIHEVRSFKRFLDLITD